MSYENKIELCDRLNCSLALNIGKLDRILMKSSKVNFLSIEGKVLSVLISQKECIVKDIPSMAGVSPRAAFDCLKKLDEIGLIKKSKSFRDSRAKTIRLEFNVLCELFCGQ